jgi:hypothetical protein
LKQAVAAAVKDIYFSEYDGRLEWMDGWLARCWGVGVGKRIVFVVVLFRRFLINDGYFEKDQMKKFFFQQWE